MQQIQKKSRKIQDARTWTSFIGMSLFATVSIISVYKSARDRKELETARDQARVLRMQLATLNDSFNLIKNFTNNTENLAESSYTLNESRFSTVDLTKDKTNDIQPQQVISPRTGLESENSRDSQLDLLQMSWSSKDHSGLRKYALGQLGEKDGLASGLAKSDRYAKLPTFHTEVFAESIVSIEEAKRNTELILGRIRSLATILKYSGISLASIPSLKPVDGPVTSEFGTRFSPFDGKKVFHTGVDIAATMGSPVKSSAMGRVAYVGTFSTLGHTVVIDHGSGTFTRYGHLKKSRVRVGQLVQKAEEIGQVGMTGNTTGPHLHYEVWMKNMAMNPQEFFFELNETPKVVSSDSYLTKDSQKSRLRGMGGE